MGNNNLNKKTASGTPRKRLAYQLALAGILAAIAVILMIFETNVPFTPFFLKLDVSDIPALLGAFILGPGWGVAIEAIKNILNLPMSTSMYVGNLANFLAGSFLVGTAGFVYKKFPTLKGSLLGFTAGTLAMTLFTTFFNYFFLLDFYAALMNVSMDEIVAVTSEVNGMVSDVRTLLVFVFIPFNLFKGVLVSLITGLLYWRLKPMLNRRGW